jgi:hypothetical protein
VIQAKLIQATGPPQCSLGLSKPPVHPVLLWTHPSHRFTPVLPWTIQATDSPQCSLGLIQATGPSRCSLGLSKPPVHPSAPLDYPSHQFTLVLPWTHPSHRFIPMLPWTYLSHRSTPTGVVLLHCTSLQCSLHFCTYTLAMQSMVSAFIQHPSTYPSRYIINLVSFGEDLDF